MLAFDERNNLENGHILLQDSVDSGLIIRR
jgi:hypothetical protein